jgi:hypothetical protein
LLERRLERIEYVLSVVGTLFADFTQNDAGTLTEHGQWQFEFARQQFAGAPDRTRIAWGTLTARSKLRLPRGRWFPLDRLSTFKPMRVEQDAATALHLLERWRALELIVISGPRDDSECLRSI